jgi:hypothetical protein
MKRFAFVCLLCASACITACAVAKPVGPLQSLPKETQVDCAKHCESIDMKLASVVIIANMSGCVCNVREGQPLGQNSGAAAASGGAVAALIAAQQQQQQQQQSAVVTYR